MDYERVRGRKAVLEEIAAVLSEGCMISIVANPYTEASQPFSTSLSHVRDVALALRALRSTYTKCESLLVLLNAYSASVQFAETLLKKVRSMGIQILKTFVLDSALSLSALLPLISEELLLTPWSSVGTIDPYIFYSHALPKEAIVIKDAVEQAMASAPKEGSGKGQVLYALSVSGALYEYVLSERHIRYVERLLNDYVRDRVSEDKFNELINRLLFNIDVHNQPTNAKELAELLPYAKVVEDFEILELMNSYYNSALDYLTKYGKAILIESPFVTYDVLPPSTNPMGY